MMSHHQPEKNTMLMQLGSIQGQLSGMQAQQNTTQAQLSEMRGRMEGAAAVVAVGVVGALAWASSRGGRRE